MALLRPINASIEQRRGEVERQRSMQGRVHRVIGFVETAEPGEAVVDVNFPAWFIERPAMSFGAELGPNEVLEAGNFPTVSMIVKTWKKQQKAGSDYYTGATLVVVTTGAAKQRLTGHWQMEGKALVGPLLSTGATDDAI